MSATGFTPGPWIADCDLPGLALKHPMVRARGCTVAEVIPQSSAEANARLIAAAPSMYAVLQKVAEHFEHTDSPLGDAVRLVLSQAVGEGR